MFIFNLKISKKIFSKSTFIIMFLIIAMMMIYGIYIIFLKPNMSFHVSDSIKSDEIFEITSDNYADILKSANENIDNYVGSKVHLIGYIYKLSNFKENQFVIARDMRISDDNTQSLIIGFLSEYKDISKYNEGTWVDVIGEITKGNFNGDIALLKVTSIKETDKPENIYVSMPSNTYIPTANMF